MRIRPVLLALSTAAFALVFGASAAAQAPRPTITVKSAGAKETFVREVNSFGSTRVGVVSGDPKASLSTGGDSLRLSVRFPVKLAAGNLCVRVVSVDGTYEAQLTIPRADLPTQSGPTTVVFPSKYTKELAGRRAADLAIEAMVAEQCEQRNGQVLVAGWQEQVSDRDFYVLVNSGDRGGSGILTTVVARFAGDSIVRFSCEDVESPRALSFDKRCHVTLPEGAPPTKLEIQRRRLGNVMPSTPVPIQWP
jgi:hypothetical protein